MTWAQRSDKLYLTLDVQVGGKACHQPPILYAGGWIARFRAPSDPRCPQDVKDEKLKLENVDGAGKLTFTGAREGCRLQRPRAKGWCSRPPLQPSQIFVPQGAAHWRSLPGNTLAWHSERSQQVRLLTS